MTISTELSEAELKSNARFLGCARETIHAVEYKIEQDSAKHEPLCSIPDLYLHGLRDLDQDVHKRMILFLAWLRQPPSTDRTFTLNQLGEELIKYLIYREAFQGLELLEKMEHLDMRTIDFSTFDPITARMSSITIEENHPDEEAVPALDDVWLLDEPEIAILQTNTNTRLTTASTTRKFKKAAKPV